MEVTEWVGNTNQRNIMRRVFTMQVYHWLDAVMFQIDEVGNGPR